MSKTNGYIKPAELFSPEFFKREFADLETEYGKFRFRSITAREQQRLAKAEPEDVPALMITLCCVDGEGNLLFSEADAEKLQDMPAGLVSRLFNFCMKLSGLDEDSGKN